MGLSYAFLVASPSEQVDLSHESEGAEAEDVVARLFPRTAYARVDRRGLLDVAFVPRGELAVGVFGDAVLLATRDAHLYQPGILHPRYRKLAAFGDIRLLTSRSVNNMFAWGHWHAGSMRRSFSVNAVAGVWVDEGMPETFEGGRPVSTDRWLELSNAALAAVLRLEGDVAPHLVDAVDWESVGLHVFRRADRD